MDSRNYLLSCEILHEIRGRIRIRSRALKMLKFQLLQALHLFILIIFR